MSATVAQILKLVNQIAPFDLAEEWDNVGLLVGNPSARVDTVLCALDMSPGVLDEAKRRGANLVVTHHPILFRGRKNLAETDAEGRLLCELVRSGVAMIAAHTNFDNAVPGVNDALANALGLQRVEALEGGMRVGVPAQATLSAFADHAERTLGGPVRRYGDPDRPIHRVAVLGGVGEDYAHFALSCGADAYLTGEMAYHKALDAVDNGLCVLEAGHAATEQPAISVLRRGLQIAANEVQYDICVLQSEAELFF